MISDNSFSKTLFVLLFLCPYFAKIKTASWYAMIYVPNANQGSHEQIFPNSRERSLLCFSVV